MRIRTLAALGLAVTALVVAVPGTAHAATGNFTYITVEARQAQLVNPADLQCHPLDPPAMGMLTNGTDAIGLLYEDPECDSFMVQIHPGQSVPMRAPVGGVVFAPAAQ